MLLSHTLYGLSVRAEFGVAHIEKGYIAAYYCLTDGLWART